MSKNYTIKINKLLFLNKLQVAIDLYEASKRKLHYSDQQIMLIDPKQGRWDNFLSGINIFLI